MLVATVIHSVIESFPHNESETMNHTHTHTHRLTGKHKHTTHSGWRAEKVGSLAVWDPNFPPALSFCDKVRTPLSDSPVKSGCERASSTFPPIISYDLRMSFLSRSKALFPGYSGGGGRVDKYGTWWELCTLCSDPSPSPGVQCWLT